MDSFTSLMPQLTTSKLISLLKRSLFGITIVTALFSCTEDNKRAADQEKEPSNKEEEKKATNLFEIEGKVFSIPSPIQTAYLLKDAGANYRNDLLNTTDKASTYATTSAKALNLGIYGADLGYATIYDKTQDAISYMAITKRLTSELGIAGLFDESMVQRFETNLGDQDSLLALVSDAFKSADKYLKNNKQDDLSVLILAGGWVETLHFATNIAKSSDNQAIRNRIGEQKITIKNLIKLMLPYNSNAKVANVINQLNELKDIYGEITFSYEFKEPETKAEEKLTIINSVSSVEMTDEQLKNITDKIAAIRNSIIN